MQTKRLFTLIALAVLAAVVFILNQLAVDHYLFWVYWWYDIVLHSLTGFVVGGLASWVAFRHTSAMTLPHALAWTVGITLLIGIGWEFFEYFTDQFVGEKNIFLDTTMDLILDAAGACIAMISIRKILSSAPIL